MRRVILAVVALAAAATLAAGCEYDATSASGKNAQGTYDSSPSKPVPHSITYEQFQSVALGSSYEDVIAQLGLPADQQESQDDYLGTSVYAYWNDANAGEYAIPEYQFAFENGELSSKSDY
jgi:hypothetical protein